MQKVNGNSWSKCISQFSIRSDNSRAAGETHMRKTMKWILKVILIEGEVDFVRTHDMRNIGNAQ